MNARFLGAVCIAGSAIIALDAVRGAATGREDFDTIALIAGIIWAIGGICGLLGMQELGAVGTKTVARVLACVPIVGFVLLVVANILQLSSRRCVVLTRFRGLFNPETTPRGGTCDLDGPARDSAPGGHFDPSNTQCRELRRGQWIR